MVLTLCWHHACTVLVEGLLPIWAYGIVYTVLIERCTYVLSPDTMFCYCFVSSRKVWHRISAAWVSGCLVLSKTLYE